MTMPKTLSLALRAVALAAAAAAAIAPWGAAQAQGIGPDAAGVGSPGADTEGWRFQLTPYVWMTGLKGDIRVARNAPTAHVSQSFTDVLNDLDAAAFLNGTARKGRYVLQLDASYASLSDQASLPMGLKAHTKIQQSALTLTGGRNWQLSPADSLDVLAGVRWWNIRASVQLQPLLHTQTRESFVDPIVALRWRHQFTPRWSTLVYADLGGLGVGSDFTWQLLAVANYQLRDNVFLSAGYRQLNVDYRSGGRRLDFGMGGPVLGATFRF